MGFEALKLELIEWLASLDNETTIQYLKVIKDSSDKSGDWWNDLTPDQKKSIEQGLKDAAEGRVISHNEVKAKYGL